MDINADHVRNKVISSSFGDFFVFLLVSVIIILIFGEQMLCFTVCFGKSGHIEFLVWEGIVGFPYISRFLLIINGMSVTLYKIKFVTNYILKFFPCMNF